MLFGAFVINVEISTNLTYPVPLRRSGLILLSGGGLATLLFSALVLRFLVLAIWSVDEISKKGVVESRQK
jgi:hypothetical protein